YPHTTCLHQLIEEQVARTPERIAVISGDEQVTFAELNERANRYAHYLQSVGIQPDDLVGVHLQRNVDMLVAVLAIMKSGGAYVPLDPMFPIDRLNMICEDAAIKVLITHSEIEAYAPEHEAEQIVIDTIDVSGFSTENPTSDVTPDNLVYIIFTSGSTGRPKGVQLQHRSVVNFLLSMQNEPGLTQDDVLLAVTTLSFDIAVLELYLPLLTGAQVVIARQEEVVDGRRLLEMIDEYNITLLQATPATWRLLLEADWDSTPNMTALCGGEALPLDLAKQITARCKALWNMYGPTETTVWSTVEPIGDVKDFISIGHPIHNTSVYVLDSADNLAPIGVPGELTIGGDGLARGYFERPKLNAEKFVPDLFVAQTTLAQRDAAIEQPRMYRTGDVARYLPDGRLQFYGRVDHQVKVRGFRIELGEIETNLGKHPHIEQNVVIVREDTPGDKQIVAYLVMADGQAVKPQDIREHLKQHLPNYMIPSVFVGLDTFPLTPNGKINRRALPKPEIADMTTEQVYVAPTNETEATVAKIWADALNVERVGIDDNFFDLGGHSILAIRIFTQIEKTFGQSLPLAALFRAPTVKDFAALLGDMNSETLDSLRSGVVPIRTTGSAPNFFIVGGGVINMNNLARNLGDEHPFYALQFQSLSEDDIMHGTVEKAATEFIKMMRGVQPEGPYYIGGSFASIVFAIEMARQLEAEGEDIAMLVAFDPIVNTFLPPRKFNKPKKSLSQRIKTRLDDYLSSEDIRERFIDDWDTFWERVQHRMWKVSFKFYDAINKPIPTWMRTGIYEEFCILRTHKVYNPSKYDGDVVLYVTPPNLEKFVAYEKYGFVNLVAGEVTVAETPGDPCSIMMEPNVQTLALKLREQIIAIDTNK
ncbi:MAG: amino acid adenylation domain-containing protein, partial [Chloroflexota bacterium]